MCPHKVFIKGSKLVTMLDEKNTKEILESLINDKPLRPGSYRGRKNTAPEKILSSIEDKHA